MTCHPVLVTVVTVVIVVIVFTVVTAVIVVIYPVLHLWRRCWQPRTLVVLVLLLQIVHGAIPPQVGLASPNEVLRGSVENSTGMPVQGAASTGGTWRIYMI